MSHYQRLCAYQNVAGFSRVPLKTGHLQPWSKLKNGCAPCGTGRVGCGHRNDVSLPIEKGDFPISYIYVKLPEGIGKYWRYRPHHLLVEKSLPSPMTARVYVNLTEGKSSKNCRRKNSGGKPDSNHQKVRKWERNIWQNILPSGSLRLLWKMVIYN